MIGSLGSVGFRNLLFTLLTGICFWDLGVFVLTSGMKAIWGVAEGLLSLFHHSSHISFFSGFSCKLFNPPIFYYFHMDHSCLLTFMKSYMNEAKAAFADLWGLFWSQLILCLRTSLQQLQRFWVDKHPRLGENGRLRGRNTGNKANN